MNMTEFFAQSADRTITSKDLEFVQKNKDGTANFSFKNGKEDCYLNRVSMEEYNNAPKDSNGDAVFHIRFGKKDPSWKNSYWYID